MSISYKDKEGTDKAETARDKIMRKCHESIEMKEKFFDIYSDQIEALTIEMAKRFNDGKKLYVMGNGGSACDALHVAVEFVHPIIEKRKPLPAIALMTDVATMTAISNDLDFSRIFVNQLKLMGQPGDMALAISTSGKSPNLIYALQTAREKGMLTISFSGKDGGRMPEVSDYCFTVPSFSIHRIQEVQETLLHILWDLVHVTMGEEDVI
ncbi:SIS domain-containing protein [bacterium]|nr:SIS domain-containing protein [bacterium]